MFKNFPTADFSAFGAPVQKLIELNTSTMTKAFELQQAAFEKQIAQSQANFEAISEIKDPKALTSFVTAKSDEAKKNLEALKAEAQVAVKSSNTYFSKVHAILIESKNSLVKTA